MPNFALKKVMQVQKITITLLTMLLCTAFSHSVSNQNFSESADELYRYAMEKLGAVPGLSIVVVKGEETVYTGSFGYANLEKKIPVTPETNFYIASSTKSFMGLAAAQLDREGVISLDAGLASFFPDTKFAPELKADQIKVRDLLTHTSGLDNSPISFRAAYSGDHTFTKLVELLERSQPNKAGYGNYQYSNVGYNIYALIVEKVTGQKWQDVLAEKIFRPLGMERTTAYMSKAEKNDWTVALPYAGLGPDRIEPVYLTKKDNTMQSAGGLITTAADAATWLKMQIGNGRLNGKQVFPVDMIRTARSVMAPHDDARPPFEAKGYGLGWHSGLYQGENVTWHFGGFPGAYTHISYLPEREIGVAVFVNDAVAGYPLMMLAAEFAYEWHVNPSEKILSEYKKRIDKLAKETARSVKQSLKHEQERAERTWQLSEPFADYAGVYRNDAYGTVKIEHQGGEQLRVSMGNMHCLGTPYTEENTMRVELVPRSGMVLQFVVENGLVKAFNFSGDVFTRVSEKSD
jgi:CubicO group peptidase (beta-lactamase class C family)